MKIKSIGLGNEVMSFNGLESGLRSQSTFFLVFRRKKKEIVLFVVRSECPCEGAGDASKH
ncbi:hypothetical protein EU522_01110 [Candidatus Thorarchaeota archaeon]|nr:MAG: hypothetical protein EU522_01110 [Candidatus Thorarchaeota archaeon]